MRVALQCLLLVALISCIPSHLVHAQGTEEWNRRAVALDLAPSPAGPGLWDVTALTDILARNTSSVVDLSTLVEILVNGTPVAGPLSVDIQLNGPTGECILGCGSNCGSLYIDGTLNTMLCREEGPGSCDCGYWITSTFPGVPAQTGDEIMVILRPAPGAAPDADTSDDRLTVVVGDKPIGWNRRIAEIQVQPSSTGPTKMDSFFDIMPLIELEGSGFTAYMDMSMELQLLVNGSSPVPPIVIDPAMDVTPWDCEDQCGTNCGGLYFDGAINTMTCHLDGPIGNGLNDCDCGYWIAAPFPGVPLQPGDEIVVILRPAPGAVPEADPSDDQAIITFNGHSNGWNRRAGEISIIPSSAPSKADSFFDVFVDIGYEASGLLGVVDVSTEVELLVNGTPATSMPLQIGVRMEGGGVDCESQCGSNCGGLYVDGAINTMTCREDGIISPGLFDCDCGYWYTANFPGVPLEPGDEIMVILRPAPGAVPEPMMDDDIAMRTFSGPAGWNRTMHSISLQPSSTGPTKMDSFFDIWPVMDLRAINTTSEHLNLSTELELLVNGTAMARNLVNIQVDGPTGDCESGCGGSCGGLYVDGVINTMTCHKDGLISPGVFDCDCGYWIAAPPFPGVELVSGDEIMVILRPAPGALPEHDPNGDRLIQTMDGEPSGWNRGIRSLAIGPNATGGFEIGVAARVEASTPLNFTDLSYEIVVMADGATVDTEIVSLSLVGRDLPLKTILCEPGCIPTDCAVAYPEDFQDTLTAGCVHSTELGVCSCGVDVYTVLPNVPIPPGTTLLTIILRPVPGALPELPPFEEDDEEEVPDGRTNTDPLPSRLSASLEQNKPNPFNPRTTIAFTIMRDGQVRLSVFDVRGNLVRTVLDENMSAGPHTVTWDGRDDDGRQSASGQYLYRIETEDWTDTKKMTLLK